MDASSIITQVSRDEDHVNSYPPPDRGLFPRFFLMSAPVYAKFLTWIDVF